MTTAWVGIVAPWYEISRDARSKNGSHSVLSSMEGGEASGVGSINSLTAGESRRSVERLSAVTGCSAWAGHDERER
jgi:hypothetical protein